MARDRTVNFVMTAVDRTRQGVQSVQRRFRGLSREVAASAGGITRFATRGVAGAIAAITAAATAAAFRLNQINAIARNLRLDPTFVRQLEILSSRLDVPAGGLEQVFRTIQDAGRDATGELSETAQALDELGINIDRFTRADSSDRLLIIVEALRGIADEGERARTATELFARQGAAALRVLLQQNPEELARSLISARDEISNLQEAAITAADEGRKAWRNFGATVQNVAFSAFGALAVSTRALVDEGEKLVDSAREYAGLTRQAADNTLETVQNNQRIIAETDRAREVTQRAIGQSEQALTAFVDQAQNTREALVAAVATAGNNARAAADEAEDALGRVAGRIRNALQDLRAARSGQIQDDERFVGREIADPREEQLSEFLDRFSDFEDARALDNLAAAQAERERTQQIFELLRNLPGLRIDAAQLTTKELKAQTSLLQKIEQTLERGSPATFG